MEIDIKQVRKQVQKDLGIENVMAIPRFQKVVINVGIGSMLKNSKDYSDVLENVKLLAGQQPVVTKAKKAVSNFKLRQGMPVGIKVTLRGPRMYDFLEKMVRVIFPRIRDFRGLSPKAFDPQGNYTVGLKEVLVFPEVNPDDVSNVHGLEITVVTSAKSKEEGYALLKEFGFPFKKEKKQETTNETK